MINDERNMNSHFFGCSGGGRPEIRRPKSEGRRKAEIRNPKSPWLGRCWIRAETLHPASQFRPSDFGQAHEWASLVLFCSLSDFGLRLSDLKPPGAHFKVPISFPTRFTSFQ